jgi:SnoaL-like domain
MDSELERKMREAIDRQEIWQVLLRYGRGLDRLDVPLARSCYWDDAIEDHGEFVGRPDDFIAWANEATIYFIMQHHGLTNHYCELAGDDAYAETHFQFMGVCQTEPHFMSMGRYVDHFQKRNGEWRILNRVTLIEHNFDLKSSTLNPVRQSVQTISRGPDDSSYQRPLRPRNPDQWKPE